MMSTREFYFPSGGIRLHCKLDLPGDEAGSRFPLVLVIPGLTGHMEEPHITAIADALPLSGYACLRAELYGHGMSGGSFHDHNLFLWALEIMDLIDYVRKMDSVSEIYLYTPREALQRCSEQALSRTRWMASFCWHPPC